MNVTEWNPMTNEKEIFSFDLDDVNIAVVVCLFSTAIARLLNLKLRIPYTLILNIFGLIIGYLKSHRDTADNIYFRNEYSLVFLRAYYSLIIVYVCFTTNIYIFRRNIWQILVMSLGCHALQQLCGVYLTDFNFSFNYSRYYYTLLSSISYSLDTTPLMRKRGIPENICALLEGESVLGLGVTLIIIDHLDYVQAKSLDLSHATLYWFIHFFIGFCIGKIYNIATKFIQSDIIVIVILIISFGSLAIPLVDTIPLTVTLYSLAFGYQVGVNRLLLVKETEKILTRFWSLIFNTMQGVMSVFFGMEGFSLLVQNFPSVSGISLLYVRVMIARAISLLILAPVLSRTGYGIKWSEAVFALWVPTSGNVAVFIGFIYRHKHPHLQYIFSQIFIFEIVRQILNGISAPYLVQFLKMTSISRMQQIQMSKSLQYILHKRRQYFRTLELNPYYASINWSKMKAVTKISSPYEALYDIFMVEIDNDVCNFVMDQPFADCLGCLNAKTFGKADSQLTEGEWNFMLYEAHQRVFHLRYAMYNHLYANEMISSPVFQILSEAINRGISENTFVLPIENIYKSWYKQTFYWKIWHKIMVHLLESPLIAVRPHSEFRSMCYSVATSKIFIILMIFLNILCVCFYVYTIINAICYGTKIYWSGWYFFCFTFLIEFILKVTALGFTFYLTSFWNKLDLILLCFVMEHIIETVSNLTNRTVAIIFYFPNCLRILNVLRLFDVFEKFNNKCVLYVDFLFSKKLGNSYEIAKTYAHCDEIVLSRLNTLIDHEKVRDIVQQEIENDLFTLMSEIGSFEANHACVVSSIKSRQLALSTIYCMRENIFMLYKEGWLQEDEYRRFDHNFIKQKQRVKYHVQCLFPIASIGKFAEQILWLFRNSHIYYYLVPRHIVKEFKAGETVVREGMFLDGVYIVLSGFLRVEFEPNIAMIKFLEEFGVLPVVEPIRWRNFKLPFNTVILTGNSFGEMSLLTDRPSDCTIIADVPTRVILIEKDTMRNGFELFNHHINGLKHLIWHSLVINLSTSILMTTPLFNNRPQISTSSLLIRAFVLSMDTFDKLLFTNHIEDAILIEGVALDRQSSSTYVAPCYIPRHTKKLIFFKQKTDANCYFVIPKLLIIPFSNFKAKELGLRRISKNTCQIINREGEMHHFLVTDNSSIDQ